jgi:hypothetical protein
MMKKLLALWFIIALSSAGCASAQGIFNVYAPVAGVQYNPGGTFQDTAATAAQIAATYTGMSNCTAAAPLLFNATCMPFPISASLGGTGESGTLTGVLKGNGTGAFTLAMASDTAATYTGASGCTGAAALLINATCAVIPAAVTGANPTATVGSAAVNGSASTFMRSDAAPPLSTVGSAGSCTNCNVTFDANGRETAQSNGSSSATSITPGTTTVIGATAPCIIDNSTSTTMGCNQTTNTVLADIAANTTFTITGSGCSPTSPTGGPFAGTFNLAAGPCTSVTITLNGATGFTAPNGFVCTAEDQTLMAAGTFIPAWQQSSSTTHVAVLPIPTAATTGGTDKISFMCTYY